MNRAQQIIKLIEGGQNGYQWMITQDIFPYVDDAAIDTVLRKYKYDGPKFEQRSHESMDAYDTWANWQQGPILQGIYYDLEPAALAGIGVPEIKKPTFDAIS